MRGGEQVDETIGVFILARSKAGGERRGMELLS